MFNMIFVNLPVENLKRSVDFFGALGFTFNPQFTDETSTCMIVSEHIYVMLLEHEKFVGFTNKPVPAKDSSEAILSFSCDSPAQVKEVAEKAFALGAKASGDTRDMGFMVSWGFEDLDGHLWELFYMNPEFVQQ